MLSRSRPFAASIALAVACALACPGAAPGQGAGPRPALVPADPWPRTVELDKATALVYQPQVIAWEGNTLQFRAVVEVTPAGSKQEIVGAVWATARTQVDRVSRIVVLEDLTLTKSSFPTLADQGAAYLARAGQAVPAVAGGGGRFSGGGFRGRR